MYPKKPIIYVCPKTNILQAGVYNRKGERLRVGNVLVNSIPVEVVAFADGQLRVRVWGGVNLNAPWILDVAWGTPGGYRRVVPTSKDLVIEVDQAGVLPILAVFPKLSVKAATRARQYEGPDLPTAPEWLKYVTERGPAWVESVVPSLHRERGRMVSPKGRRRVRALRGHLRAVYLALWGAEAFAKARELSPWGLTEAVADAYLEAAYELWRGETARKAGEWRERGGK